MKSVALTLLFVLATSQAAQAAYVDPSVGGMLFQVLAAGFAVLSGVALLFARQIRMFIARARRALGDARGRDDERMVETQGHTQHAED
jgi:hypothetical protein